LTPFNAMLCPGRVPNHEDENAGSGHTRQMVNPRTAETDLEFEKAKKIGRKRFFLVDNRPNG